MRLDISYLFVVVMYMQFTVAVRFSRRCCRRCVAAAAAALAFSLALDRLVVVVNAQSTLMSLALQQVPVNAVATRLTVTCMYAVLDDATV